MKLPNDTAIARRKLDEYLLLRRDEDDKSGFLALAGYTLEQAEQLMNDLRAQLLPLDAEFFDQTDYGTKYGIRGTLTGPNGRVLRVVSIWMKETATGVTKFVLYSRTSYEIRPVFARCLGRKLPERRLRRGDVATVVDHHPGRPDQESGYSLEVFNAIGETLDVVTVRESQIEPLTANELLTVRSVATTAR